MVRKTGAVLEVILGVSLYEDAQFPGSQKRTSQKWFLLTLQVRFGHGRISACTGLTYMGFVY